MEDSHQQGVETTRSDASSQTSNVTLGIKKRFMTGIFKFEKQSSVVV